MDGDSADVPGNYFHLSRVDPSPELNVKASDGLVESSRGPNSPLGPIEKSEDSVTSCFHEPAAVPVENELDALVVGCHDVEPLAVAETLRSGSRIHNVGEQD